jgi:5-(carboxyamino)imidazole ribonucleotide synthase
VADRHISADYLDPRGLATSPRSPAAATTEFENVPANALEFLARNRARHACGRQRGHRAGPHPREDVPRRARLRGGSIRGPALADDARNCDAALLPGIVKSARFGYDGKGQIGVRTRDEIDAAWRAMKGQPCVLEKRVALACEISVIVARNEHDEASTWPVAENVHRDGILDVSIVPARVSAELTARARDIATGVATALDYRGCCASRCSSPAMARCSSTKSRLGRTTAAITRSTPA